MPEASGDFGAVPALPFFCFQKTFECGPLVLQLLTEFATLATRSTRTMNQPDALLFPVLVLAALASGAKRLDLEVGGRNAKTGDGACRSSPRLSFEIWCIARDLNPDRRFVGPPCCRYISDANWWRAWESNPLSSAYEADVIVRFHSPDTELESRRRCAATPKAVRASARALRDRPSR